MNILPILLKDGYKVGHIKQYPEGTTLVYSNLTPRTSRVPGVEGVIFFGLQYFLKEYLIRQFTEGFFALPLTTVLRKYKRRIDHYLGPGMNLDHIAGLHALGYLPLHIKAVPEGTLVPFRVPVLTLYNTHPSCFWLTNMVETLLSNVLWQASTSATTAFRYRQVFDRLAAETGGDPTFVPWQGHDFSFRGLSGVEAACLSGAGHLLSFTGTDTIPAIDFLEEFYGADCEKELIGGSIPATEHSVICAGGEDKELATIRRLLTTIYPTGPVSDVADSWDFWRFLTEYLPLLKDLIMSREGKFVVRPDSGDPVQIICGDPEAKDVRAKGAIQVLWDLFGGTLTATGYKVLDSHIGLIYGDSITPERQVQILERLKAKGFASTNVVLGIGSYTYQYVTRDTYGFAMKATYCERQVLMVDGSTRIMGFPIFKAPKTDDGVKNSAKGLLCVRAINRKIDLLENVPWSMEQTGLLQTVFKDSKLAHEQTLSDIRQRVKESL